MEVRAPVIVGVYPMRIARFVFDHGGPSNGQAAGTNGFHPLVPPIGDAAPEPVADEAG